MPLNRAFARGAHEAVVIAIAVMLAIPASAADSSDPEKLAAELDAVRQESIGSAREAQQQQATVAALEHEIDLFGRDAAARQRGLDESQAEQAQLLGALERLARLPPDKAPLPAGAPLDRVHGDILLAATIPALRSEAQALAVEIEAVKTLRARIAAKQDDLAGARDRLAHGRERLAQILAHRAELIHQLLPDNGRPVKPLLPGRDIGDLLGRADAAADRRGKALLAQARASLSKEEAAALTLTAADPSRPQDLRPFDAGVLSPVSGAVLQGPAKAAGFDPEDQGMSIASSPGAVVVAPFDGQVVYAGPFRPYELVLIIRHTDGYHSLLAGLGRADIAVGQWVLAGEPVGVMPDAAGQGSGGVIYFELRRDGRPVDPQPWLAQRDESTKRGDKAGD